MAPSVTMFCFCLKKYVENILSDNSYLPPLRIFSLSSLCLFSLRHGSGCLVQCILVNIGLLLAILRKVLKKVSFDSEAHATFNKHVDGDCVFLEYDAVSLFNQIQTFGTMFCVPSSPFEISNSSPLFQSFKISTF
jgi:hypothetical protein